MFHFVPQCISFSFFDSRLRAVHTPSGENNDEPGDSRMRARSRNRTPPFLFASPLRTVHNRRCTRCDTGWRWPGATTPAARNWDILGSSATLSLLGTTRIHGDPVFQLRRRRSYNRGRASRPNEGRIFISIFILLARHRRLSGSRGMPREPEQFSERRSVSIGILTRLPQRERRSFYRREQ